MSDPVRQGPAGVPIRTDLVEVFVFRRTAAGVELLQMRRRSASKIAPGAWQPVMGHLAAGERAFDGARREVEEETGLHGAACLGWWQLEQVRPFFVAGANAVFLAPRFVVEADSSWEPVLNREHVAYRWVSLGEADAAFVWPGQREALREFARDVLEPGAPGAALLRLA